ncbi:MAG: hypothetical protein ACP5SH_13200 [Syntrophobacteraceae bacterium]
MIAKFPAILVLLVMVGSPFCTAMAKNAGPSCAEKSSQYNLGRLLLTQTSVRGDYFLKFFLDGKKLAQADCAFKTHGPGTVASIPFPGCHTLLAYCYSGGAHCCTTLFIATDCGPVSSLDRANLENDNEEVKFVRAGDGLRREIKVHDWQFAYYGSPDMKIQFSFADSPAMVRLLVFSDGHWRVDRPGEFKSFYSRLLHEAGGKASTATKAGKKALASCLAMQAAYYDLMTGASAGEAGQVLKNLLPVGLRSETAEVMRDIRRAVSRFDPVAPVGRTEK